MQPTAHLACRKVRDNRSMRRWSLRSQVVAASAFWIAVTGLFVMQVLTMANRPGEPAPTLPVFVWTGGFYLSWLPLTVAVWRLTGRWSPAELGWARFLARHGAVALMVAAAHGLFLVLTARLVLGEQPGSTVSMFVAQLRNRSYFELIIYAGVVASGQAVWLYERWRDRDADAARLQAELAAARLTALQAHVQPHFLFNSLHTIASLAREARHEDVVRLVAELGDLLRASIDDERPTRRLGEEVDLARRYLNLQRARFGDRLSIAIDVPADLLDEFVPTFTLQPLVDNAVRHGIATSPAGGTVRVRARRDHGGVLRLEVEEDASAPDGTPSAHGTGLTNLAARLEMLFGPGASLRAGRFGARGFLVTVRVPRPAA